MNAPLTCRRLMGAICLVFAGLLFAREVQGERTYLQVVGSPSLRFEVATTNFFVLNPQLFAPATNSAAASPVAPPDTNATNLATASRQARLDATNASQLSIAGSAVTDTRINPEQHFNSDFSASAASDLLTVTPQMITEYLKPDQNRGNNGTNGLDQPGVVVFVPAEMQFTPPTQKNSTESQAIYRSQ